MSNRYAKVTCADFDRLLAQVIDEQNPQACDLLTVPGVYELVSEHYNNDVLAAWDAEQGE